MKKVFTAALIGALAVGVSAVPAQANTVEDGGTTCVIHMHDDSLAGFAYSVSAVYAYHMNDARVQFMSQGQAREVVEYLDNDWKQEWDKEYSTEWQNAEEVRQRLEEDKRDFDVGCGFLVPVFRRLGTALFRVVGTATVTGAQSQL